MSVTPEANTRTDFFYSDGDMPMKQWLVWFVIMVAGLVASWSLFEAIPKSDARDQFFGNFLATVLGAVVGIPIALRISRHLQDVQDAKVEDAKKEERESKKRRVLGLVESELVANLAMLQVIIPEQDKDPTVVTFSGMKNDLWMSLADSGELHWLDDLDVLDSVTNAYYLIRRIIMLEEHYFDGNFNLAVSSGGKSSYMGKRTTDVTIQVRVRANEAIETALKALRSKSST